MKNLLGFLIKIGLFFSVLLLLVPVYAQKVKPYSCGYFSKTFEELKENFEAGRAMGAASGEKIASVGASNGYREVQTSVFIENINWTLQDIDTSCLNEREFQKVIRYHEQLAGTKINATFNLVVGEKDQTNLTRSFFDRILLINVYHELSNKEKILEDIRGALNEKGVLVVMERMGKKPGERHGDCGLPKLFEPDYLADMKKAGFDLVFKSEPKKKTSIIFYTFKAIN